MKTMFPYNRRIVFSVLMLLLACLLALLAYGIDHNAVSTIEEELGTNAKNVSVITARLIAEDLDHFRELATSPDFAPGSFDETYQNMMLDVFRQIKEQTGVNYLQANRDIC